MFGDDGLVGDGVWAAGVDLDVAFVACDGVAVFVFGDVALDVVGVHVVGAHADGFGSGFVFAEVAFGHDEVGDHASCFADVDLVWPAVGLFEFVFSETPFAHLFADIFGGAGVVGEEPHESLLVVDVFLEDLFAFFVGGFGVFVVHADVVGGEGAVVVGICFGVGDGVEFAPGLAPTGVEVACEQFVLEGVVVGGFGEGDHIFGDVGEAHAVAVGLDAFVGGAFFAGRAGVDAWEEAGGGVAGFDVGVDGCGELVFAGVACLYAVECFAVLCV